MENNTKKEWVKLELIDLDAEETEHNYGVGHDGFFAETHANAS